MTTKHSLPTDPNLLSDPGRPLIHRDLSWLQFNDRVLSEADDSENPLLERAKFLAITSSNLDEFFMIRVSSLLRSLATASKNTQAGEEKNSARIVKLLLSQLSEFGENQNKTLKRLQSALSSHGIYLHTQPDTSNKHSELAKKLFEEHLLPHLPTPENFKLSALSTLENLQYCIIFSDQALLKIPKSLPPTLTIEDTRDKTFHVFFADELIAEFSGALFGFKGKPGILRLTRDADITVEISEDTTSIPDVIRSGLNSRERGRPIRIQAKGFAHRMLELIAQHLKLRNDQVFTFKTSCLFHGLWPALNKTPERFHANAQLSLKPFYPIKTPFFSEGEDIFKILKSGDILLHHPYDSFDDYITWIARACDDPSVTMIEQTVYRIDSVSPLIESLKRAAQSKKVRVLIELRARFDEHNNLRLAEELRQSGVEVAFGFGKLKLHAKVALVTRQENGTVCRYTHLSTGNYNAATASKYVDMGLLTSNAEIGEDARHFFDCVLKREIPTSFKKLVSAPSKLHRKIFQHIEAETKAAEAGHPARIVAKVNALVDEAIIEQLYKASEKGVQVDLIVRGACSLIPGAWGLSDRIRVISIVDRFLEHSRIYYFQNSRALYLSSADWMPRNFFSRLELAFPILDERVFRYIEQTVIASYFADNEKARELSPKGTWRRIRASGKQKSLRSQTYFEELAINGYKGTPLGESTYPDSPRTP